MNEKSPKMEIIKNKCFKTDGWVIKPNKDERYDNMRNSLKEMNVLKAAKAFS